MKILLQIRQIVRQLIKLIEFIFGLAARGSCMRRIKHINGGKLLSRYSCLKYIPHQSKTIVKKRQKLSQPKALHLFLDMSRMITSQMA